MDLQIYLYSYVATLQNPALAMGGGNLNIEEQRIYRYRGICSGLAGGEGWDFAEAVD